jgi:glycosyl transferase family 87
VRDWRCYALTAVFPFTRSALDLGTVAPLLLLAIAVAWHWRDRLLRPALAVGAAIALKLFLWPAAVWLAIRGRIGTALTSVAVAVALVLLPWAIIGFAGIGDYPSVLRHLSRQEAAASYSGTAFGVRAHLPYAVSLVLSLVVGIALLAAAVWVGRDTRRSPRDRDVATLTLALAAALVASPIVWVHYFLLLLVPLALTRPRLSWLWLVPFAYYPLGESAWPAGDTGKLALALVTTAILIGAALVRGAGDVRQAAPGRQAAWSLPRRLRRPTPALEPRPELPEAPQPR